MAISPLILDIPLDANGRPIIKRADGLLSVDDVAILTGRKLKRMQRDQLRAMKIPFAVNACGEPLVPVAAIEGRAKQAREEVAELERHFARIFELIGWKR